MDGISAPLHHVTRPRLASELQGASLAIIEAGSGYGKSMLINDLRRTCRDGSISIELAPWHHEPTSFIAAFTTAIAAELTLPEFGDDPAEVIDQLARTAAIAQLPIFIDDAHHLSAASAALLVQFVRASTTIRIVIAARRLPEGAERLRPIAGAASISGRELALNLGELRELAVRFDLSLAPDQLELLLATTGGWPAASVLALSRLHESALIDTELQRFAAAPTVLRMLISESLSALDPGDVAALRQCSVLPRLSEPLMRAVGSPGLYQRAADAGLPVAPRADGWLEFPGPVADQLSEHVTITAETAQAAATEYLTAGATIDALRSLTLAGMGVEAASMLVHLSPRALATLEPIEVFDMVSHLSHDVIRQIPRVLLVLARVSESTTNFRRRSDALAEAKSLTASDAPLHREVLAEIAQDLARDVQTDAADALAHSILESAARTEIAARCRALDALGRTAAWRGDDAAMDEAAQFFEESARLAHQLNEPLWEAASLRQLGDMVHFTAGRYDDAVAALDRAIALTASKPSRRLTFLTVRAEVLFSGGRFEDAHRDIEEVFTLSERLHDDRVIGYGHWERARHCAASGDVDGVTQSLREVEAHRGDWFHNQTGVYFLSDAADFCDRVGLSTLATQYMDRARARIAEATAQVLLVDASINARHGNPQSAIAALDALDATATTAGGVERKDRWLIALIRAHAWLRIGDPRAEGAAIEAFEAASQLGVAMLPMQREPELTRGVLALAQRAGSHAALAVHDVAVSATLRLLGSADLVVGGVVHPLPNGLPGQLAAFVAVAGGRVHQELAIEALFPDADIDRGAAQLRNVLNRLKKSVEALGIDAGIVIRDGDTLVIAPGIAVDLQRFGAEAQRALAGHDAASARSALALVRGPLLPDEIYPAWAVIARERATRLQVRLWTLIANIEAAHNNLDAANMAFEELITLERDDEERYLEPAEMYANANRPAKALQYVRRAETAMAELGLELSQRGRLVRDEAVRLMDSPDIARRELPDQPS